MGIKFHDRNYKMAKLLARNNDINYFKASNSLQEFFLMRNNNILKVLLAEAQI